MTKKTVKRDVYVVSLNEQGDGKVRVVLRDGDPPHKRSQAGDNIHPAPGPEMGPRGEDLAVNLPADEAPAIYEALTLSLSQRDD